MVQEGRIQGRPQGLLAGPWPGNWRERGSAPPGWARGLSFPAAWGKRAPPAGWPSCPLWHGPQGVAGGAPPGLHQELCQSCPGSPWSSGAAGGTWEGPGHPGGRPGPEGPFARQALRTGSKIKSSFVAAAVWPGAPALLIQRSRNSGCTEVCGHTKLDPPAPWRPGRWCGSPRACLRPFAMQTGSCAPEREPCPGSPRPLPQSESWAQASDPGPPPWVPRWWREERRGGRRARPPAAGC